MQSNEDNTLSTLKIVTIIIIIADKNFAKMKTWNLHQIDRQAGSEHALKIGVDPNRNDVHSKRTEKKTNRIY